MAGCILATRIPSARDTLARGSLGVAEVAEVAHRRILAAVSAGILAADTAAAMAAVRSQACQVAVDTSDQIHQMAAVVVERIRMGLSVDTAAAKAPAVGFESRPTPRIRRSLV